MQSLSRLEYYYMRLFTFGMAALWACACQTAMPQSMQQQVQDTEQNCRQAAPIQRDSEIELLLDGVARAQMNDLRCGPPADNVRICRALFLISVVDPAHYLENPAMLNRVADAQVWALSDATASAPPEVEGAMNQLLTATVTIRSSSQDAEIPDAEIVEALHARADPSVLAAIDSYWDSDCG